MNISTETLTIHKYNLELSHIELCVLWMILRSVSNSGPVNNICMSMWNAIDDTLLATGISTVKLTQEYDCVATCELGSTKIQQRFIDEVTK
jgi:hypothetical protein